MLNNHDNSLTLASLVINNLLEEETITLNGFGSKESHTTRIIVSQHGAGSEYIAADGKICSTNIPALNTYEWNPENLKYLKFWLASVLNDESVKSSYRIKIDTFRSWKEKIQ